MPRSSGNIATHASVLNAAQSAEMAAPVQQKKDAAKSFFGNPNYQMYAHLASDNNLHNNCGQYIEGIPFATNSAQSLMATFAGVGYIAKDDNYISAKRSFPNSHMTSHIVTSIGNTLNRNFSNAENFAHPRLNLAKNGPVYN